MPCDLFYQGSFQGAIEWVVLRDIKKTAAKIWDIVPLAVGFFHMLLKSKKQNKTKRKNLKMSKSQRVRGHFQRHHPRSTLQVRDEREEIFRKEGVAREEVLTKLYLR